MGGITPINLSNSCVSVNSQVLTNIDTLLPNITVNSEFILPFIQTTPFFSIKVPTDLSSQPLNYMFSENLFKGIKILKKDNVSEIPLNEQVLSKDKILSNNTIMKECITDQILRIDIKGKPVQNEGSFTFNLQKGEKYILNTKGKIVSIIHKDESFTSFEYLDDGKLLYVTNNDYKGKIVKKYPNEWTYTQINKKVDGNKFEEITFKDSFDDIMSKKININGTGEFFIHCDEGQYYLDRIYHDGTRETIQLDEQALQKLSSLSPQEWIKAAEMKENFHEQQKSLFYDLLNSEQLKEISKIGRLQFNILYENLGIQKIKLLDAAQLEVLSKMDNNQLRSVLSKYGKSIVNLTPMELITFKNNN